MHKLSGTPFPCSKAHACSSGSADAHLYTARSRLLLPSAPTPHVQHVCSTSAVAHLLVSRFLRRCSLKCSYARPMNASMRAPPSAASHSKVKSMQVADLSLSSLLWYSFLLAQQQGVASCNSIHACQATMQCAAWCVLGMCAAMEAAAQLLSHHGVGHQLSSKCIMTSLVGVLRTLLPRQCIPHACRLQPITANIVNSTDCCAHRMNLRPGCSSIHCSMGGTSLTAMPCSTSS